MKQIPHHNFTQETRLDDLPLTVRSLNVFNNAYIVTLGDLLKCTTPELLRFRNMGHATLIEVIALLDVLGFPHKLEIPHRFSFEKLIEYHESHAKRLRGLAEEMAITRTKFDAARDEVLEKLRPV